MQKIDKYGASLEGKRSHESGSESATSPRDQRYLIYKRSGPTAEAFHAVYGRGRNVLGGRTADRLCHWYTMGVRSEQKPILLNNNYAISLWQLLGCGWRVDA